jgi:hypothetical protein
MVQGEDDPIDKNEPKEDAAPHPEPTSPTVSSRSKKTPTKRTKHKSSGGREFLTPGKGSESEREESNHETVPVVDKDEPTLNKDPESKGIVMSRKFFGGDGNWTEREMTLGARGGVLTQYITNTLQGNGQRT